MLPVTVAIVVLAILAIGLLHPLALHAAPLSRSLLPARAMEPVGLLLLLKAFSAGCSALTGVEAIANGVPLFKPPRVRRSKRTELLLGVILGATSSPASLVRVHVHGRAAPLGTPVTRSGAQAKASRGRYQPGGCARP